MEEQAYIAAYFEGLLHNREKAEFEERCQNDRAFAAEVAAYVMMRDALREELYQQKRARFAELFKEAKEGDRFEGEKGRRNHLFKNLVWYAAAACVCLIAAWLIFFRADEPKALANAYAAVHFKQLGVTMGPGGQEMMQQGIAAFNNRRYTEAFGIFKALSTDSSLKAEALKNMGITQLMLRRYAEAIDSFDQLAKMDLFTNPGLFYKAIALMQRSEPGDLEDARKCLEEVVNRGLPGKSDAEIWLEKL